MSGVLDVVVIGAGWAGLGISHGLRRSGVSHVVLERGRIGETWRSQRWDSFHFNIPRVLTVMPGDHYDGSDPEGAMTRDEFVGMLEGYVSRNSLPVQIGESVTEVTPDGANGYHVRTQSRMLNARNVVVASGSLNRPRRPAVSQRIPAFVRQIDASDYRSATALEPGAILVVGSGQSGGQIAKDLSDAGRQVFFATSKIGRIQRRYRGRDVVLWLVDCGLMDIRREEFVLPSGAIPGRPLQGALETISLQSLSAQGVVLLGRVASVDGKVLTFAGDVAENVRFADENSATLRRKIDDYIARNSIVAPPATDDPAEVVPPKIPFPPITSLDLETSGISTMVWCTGFDGDFSWVKVPFALGADQQPSHVDGIGAASGVYFAGLDFASTRKSGTILSSIDESRTIVGHIVRRLGQL
ncbi:NAD(P)/FAD-dependent oxidoreductase [Mesorhizobium dulcispinae]|uniref:NAD(P)/FAD-dependent oxidoreductase n=1 Tax=Mesorhizobium dulcispinae TaxID=3072316 RepID=UPI002A23B485|nr:NAD(P)/FAD-dependent oxidoreductase [Mesorhizobium sp. VK23D]MDX8521515.1 NAD(P)/FAD-dependent oxidoreductase [Mesorhizobium sp. VK23D]